MSKETEKDASLKVRIEKKIHGETIRPSTIKPATPPPAVPPKKE